MSLRPVPSHAALLALTCGDAWVRWTLDPDRMPPVWQDPDAGLVAVLRTRRGPGASLVLLTRPGADPARALAAAVPLVERESPDSVTAPHEAAIESAAVLPLLAPSGPGTGWDWMWMPAADAAAIPPTSSEDDVEWLDVADPAVAAQLTVLLDRHSPRHSARPGDPRVAGWVGVREHAAAGGSGELIACAAWFEQVPGVPLLASVAVHPRARGRGLGAAVIVALIRRAVAAGCPAVTVDLYADNDDARRLYRRLGFRTARRFVSWAR